MRARNMHRRSDARRVSQESWSVAHAKFNSSSFNVDPTRWLLKWTAEKNVCKLGKII